MYIINTLYYLIILDIIQDTVAHHISWPADGRSQKLYKKNALRI